MTTANKKQDTELTTDELVQWAKTYPVGSTYGPAVRGVLDGVLARNPGMGRGEIRGPWLVPLDADRLRELHTTITRA